MLAPLLAGWLFYSLYQQLQSQPQLHESLSAIKKMPYGENAWKFWLVFVLVFVNWGFEAKKWQTLVKALQPMSFFMALKSVLCGVALSLNTPNRIGEYMGRILFIREGSRIKAASLSVVGSMAQLIITLLMGCGGLIYFIVRLSPQDTVMGLTAFWLKLFLFFNVVIVATFALFFFKLSWIIRMVEKIPYAKKYVEYVSVLDHFDAKILLRLLFISMGRYLVFIIQYIIMFQLLAVSLHWWQSFWIVTLLFWVLAIVPSFAIAELGVRGKFALALFTLFSNNMVGIVGATFGIWLMNLFIPAAIGCLFIIGLKIFKNR